MKRFSDLPFTIRSMSCINYFLRPNKLATTSVPVVMDSPYRNYNLNTDVKTLFITCCTGTFINTVVCLRSFIRLVVLCVVALSSFIYNVYLFYYIALIYLLVSFYAKLALNLRLSEFFNKTIHYYYISEMTIINFFALCVNR